MPKFGKYRIKNQLSCLILENPALIPIQMFCIGPINGTMFGNKTRS